MLGAHALIALVVAYHASQHLSALREEDQAPADVDHESLKRFFHDTGVPVPRRWRPSKEGSGIRHRSGRKSVAQLTEDKVAPEAIITYVSPTRTSQNDLRSHRELLRRATRRLSDPLAGKNCVDADGYPAWCEEKGAIQKPDEDERPAAEKAAANNAAAEKAAAAKAAQEQAATAAAKAGQEAAAKVAAEKAAAEKAAAEKAAGDEDERPAEDGEDDGMAAWEAAEQEARKQQKEAEDAVKAAHGGDAPSLVPDELCEFHGTCDRNQTDEELPPADWAETPEWKKAEEEVNQAQKVEDERAAKEAEEEAKRQREKDLADKKAAQEEKREAIRCAKNPKKCEAERKKKEKKEKLDPSKRTGIHRCGFTWDDAAVKSGSFCSDAHPECGAPPDTTDNPDSYWYGKEYRCYDDLPELGVRAGGKQCRHVSKDATDSWCTEYCSNMGTKCDPNYCDCSDGGTGLEDSDAFKMPETFNISAAITDIPNYHFKPDKMPRRNATMVEAVIAAGEAQPSGLPECTWAPGPDCSNTSQYECTAGAMKGRCSGDNWFDKPESGCTASCVHASLLNWAPYYALWYPGPLAKDWRRGEERPRYQHVAERLTFRSRGVDLSKSEVMMSDICKNADNHFTVVALFSPKYRFKAERLLRSCARVGVCCKATLLPPDAFGPGAPEGSEQFRFETIASKPSFIRDEMDATEGPVAFMDVDLEFHSFPQLFVPGSWPGGGRDVAIFNYWGNETDWEHASVPTTGSGVVFFNQTGRARAVLTAWAEAMAWEENTRAPDDQVLDTLLHEGGWLGRASYGWLPSSYMRTMPAYYRGVEPVIDHDHGSAPGLLKHSEAKPHLPPVDYMELCDPHHDDPDHVHEAAPVPRQQQEEEPEPVIDDDADTEAANTIRPEKPENPMDEEVTKRLPPGTCKATNEKLKGDKEAQKQWDRWCDENCIAERWGGLGEDKCRGGVETGVVGCVCEQGVEPVSITKDGRIIYSPPAPPSPPPRLPPPLAPPMPPPLYNEDGTVAVYPDPPPQQAQSGSAPLPKQGWADHDAPAPKLDVPQGKCMATNPTLSPSAKKQWGGWCDEQCKPPSGDPSNCATPEMTGAAGCVCGAL